MRRWEIRLERARRGDTGNNERPGLGNLSKAGHILGVFPEVSDGIAFSLDVPHDDSGCSSSPPRIPPGFSLPLALRQPMIAASGPDPASRMCFAAQVWRRSIPYSA